VGALCNVCRARRVLYAVCCMPYAVCCMLYAIHSTLNTLVYTPYTHTQSLYDHYLEDPMSYAVCLNAQTLHTLHTLHCFSR
jgi:hypothetical protein